MKEYRFIKEYCNYVKGRYKASDLPNDLKKRYQKELDTLCGYVYGGILTVSEAMETIVKADKWVSAHGYYGGQN